jgi:hypothetical protein
MSKAHRFHTLYQFQLRVLLLVLPLILLGITFWFGGELVTKQLLSRPYRALDKLQADLQLTIQLNLNATILVREIEQEQEFTLVELKTIHSELKTLQFELPNIPSNPQESVLIQQLGIFSPSKKLKENTQLRVPLPVTLEVIKVEIDHRQELSRVVVMASNSLVTKLEFEFPVTDINVVEAMIGKTIGISPQNIRKLVRYQISR